MERINAASELNKVILYTSVKDFCCLCWTSAGIEQNGVAPKIILVRAPVVSVADGASRSLTKARTLISDILNFTQFRDFKIQRCDGNEHVAKLILRSFSLYNDYSHPLTLSNVGEASTISKVRNREKSSSLLVHVLHKTRN